jgi:hypothetical protein
MMNGQGKTTTMKWMQAKIVLEAFVGRLPRTENKSKNKKCDPARIHSAIVPSLTSR